MARILTVLKDAEWWNISFSSPQQCLNNLHSSGHKRIQTCLLTQEIICPCFIKKSFLIPLQMFTLCVFMYRLSQQDWLSFFLYKIFFMVQKWYAHLVNLNFEFWTWDFYSPLLRCFHRGNESQCLVSFMTSKANNSFVWSFLLLN